MTSAEPFPLLLDEPDVDGDIVSGVPVTRGPLATEEFGGSGVLGFGTEQQQELQQQSEPVAVGGVAASNGPGAVRGAATSSRTGSVRRSVLQKQGGLGQRGASTHPFDPGIPKYKMLPVRPENEPDTVWGGYDEENEEEQGGYSSSNSSSNSSTSSSTRLDERWDGTSSFPFDRGKTSPAFPRHDMFECSIA